MWRYAILAGILVVVLAACLPGDDDEEPTQTPIIVTATQPPAADPTNTVAPTATDEPTATEEPTATATIAATATTPPPPPTSAPATATLPSNQPTATQPAAGGDGDIQLVQSGFGQVAAGEEVGWGIVIENTNTESAIEDLEYSIVFLDDAGTIVETDDSRVPLIFPGQRTGFGGTTFVDDGVTISSMEVQLLQGSPVAIQEARGFTTESVNFFPDEFFPRATALVNNPTQALVTDLRVNAVTFDANGNINGGGFTFLSMAGPESLTGVDVSITTGGDVANTEIFANLSFLSDAIDPAETPFPIVTQFGFGQEPNGNNIGWGALIQNPSATELMRSMEHLVWFQDADGRVLDASSSFVDVLPPGGTVGVADDFVFLPDGTTAATMSILTRPGSLEATDITTWFTTENVTFIDDDFFPEVTGAVNNPFPRDLEDLEATAIAYDEAGNIIGGGFTFIDFALANSATGVQIGVTVSAVPARVEIYAFPSSLTDF